jgi:predicted dehydrogenase
MAKVALVGANGHGLHHRRRITALTAASPAAPGGHAALETVGIELVALVDPKEIADPPPEVPLFREAGEMLAAVKPDVVIVCTPPATHLPISAAALRAGADVLVEKPPVLNLSEHDELSKVEQETGRVVQVGFQALGSPQLPLLRKQAPCDVSVVSSWQRDDAYWNRSAWAGKLPLDGALRNPFAHAIMQALSINDSEPVLAEVAWCRTRQQLEVDDTSTLRLTLANGHRILIAATLAGDDYIDGRLKAGEFEGDFRHSDGVSLLGNLIAHRATGEPLLAPLRVTRPFTAVVQALSTLPKPAFVPPPLSGIAAALTDCAREFALLTEINNPWAAMVSGGTATIG